jgi:gamma-glutamyl phosphate reductase
LATAATWLRRAKAASAEMATLNSGVKIKWLHRSAELLRQNVKAIEQANAEDLKPRRPAMA